MLRARISDVLQHARRLAGGKPDPLTDGELLRRFVATAEGAAFEELLRRHGAMVLRVCGRLLPGREDAEDIFQATFLLLARKADSIRRHASVGPWLHGVALRLAQQARAAVARRRRHEGRAALRPADDPLDELSVREARAVLDEELARLPEKYRAPLVLCYLEGKSRDEAAEQLGWPVRLIKSRLEQARDRLRGRLRGRGLSLSGTLLAAMLVEEAARAALPLPLARATAQAARACAAGAGAGSKVTGRVAALVQGGLNTAAGSPKGKWVALVLAGLVAGVSLLAYPAPGKLPPRAKPPEAAPAREAGPPRQQKPARTDRFGDALPPGALARLGTVRFRPGLALALVAFSADGRLLATATQNTEADENLGSLCLWDRATGKRLRRFGVRKMPYLCLALAPDGKTLATQDPDGAVRLWDAATGKELRQITRGSVVFSGPGKGEDQQTRGVGFTFSPDGKTLAARGPDRAIHLWETATGKEIRKLTADPEDSHPLAFSPDGKILATSADKVVRLWAVATGKVIARLEGHPGLAGAPALSPDGKMFTALARTPGRLLQVTAYVWDLASCKMRRKSDLPPNPVFACCLSPDGTKALAGGHAGGMRLYDLSTGKELSRPTAPFSGTLFAAAFSPDGQTIAAGGENRVLQLWDAKTGQPLPSPGHQGIIQSLSLSADGKQLASVASDEGVRLWDVAAARPVGGFRSPRGEFSGVAFAPDGRTLAAAGRGRFVRLLEAATGKEVRRFEGAAEGHRAVALSPDGRVVAAGGRDRSIHLWEAATGKRLLRLLHPPADGGPDGGVLCLAFSPDGRRLASGGWGAAACVWDVATGQQWCELRGHDYWVSSLAFSPDGKTLAVAHWGKTIRLCEVLSGKERGRLAGHADRVTQVACAPDGRLASASHDRTVRVWDLLAAQQARCFAGHEAVVGPLAFSADGKRLVSGGWDTTILVWDVQGLPRPRRAKPAALSPKEREALWAELGGLDAARAYRAVRTLTRAGEQAASFLADRLQPVPAADAREITRLIADLGSGRFTVRAKAEAELEKLAELAEPALRRALGGEPRSLELRRRVERLLQRLQGPIVSGGQLRLLRAVEILEHVGTPGVQPLRRLAAGAPGAWLTREARAALGRLNRRSGDN
jgi:RNA polymerase sigma factor (sigma-70 family)